MYVSTYVYHNTKKNPILHLIYSQRVFFMLEKSVKKVSSNLALQLHKWRVVIVNY